MLLAIIGTFFIIGGCMAAEHSEFFIVLGLIMVLITSLRTIDKHTEQDEEL